MAAPTILKAGINNMDKTTLDESERPDEYTKILVFLMLEIPDDRTTDPIKNEVMNMIIINGIYAIVYCGPANSYSIILDKAAIPSAPGMYISEIILIRIFMLFLKPSLLFREKNVDNFGINRLDIGITRIIAAEAIISAKLYIPRYDRLIK